MAKAKKRRTDKKGRPSAVVPADKPAPPQNPEAIVSSAAATDYVPTPAEAEIRDRVLQKRRVPRLPKATFSKSAEPGGASAIHLEHADPRIGGCLLAAALGADDIRLADHLLVELANTLANGAAGFDEKKLQYATTIVEGIQPKDTIEALLATQMAGVHLAAMKGLRFMRDAETLPAQEAASNMANKMMRTFAAQVEALKKHRSAGEQIIKVQHVTVNEGGQAVVGIVNGGRGTSQIERQPHEPGQQVTGGAPLLSHVEADAPAVPSAGSERVECVPLPRSEGRSAKGRGQRRLASRSTH